MSLSLAEHILISASFTVILLGIFIVLPITLVVLVVRRWKATKEREQWKQQALARAEIRLRATLLRRQNRK